MDTHNIVSTPNITGNIGSCTTQEVDVETYSGFSKSIGYHVTTNSCTGNVEKVPYKSFGFGATFLILFGVFFLGCIVTVMFSNS